MSGRVELWDAINAVVVASGGSESSTGVARQKGVVRVERAVDALVDASRATAHAAGYAEAVASIVVDLRRQSEGLDLTGEKKLSRYVGGLASRYATGAHVGAAKKGGG